MQNKKKLSFHDFLRMGNEQTHTTTNSIKKGVYNLVGILPINPKIRSGRIINEVMRHDLPCNASVLDAGFGHGLAIFYLSKKFPNWTITGYELDDQAVKNALLINKSIKRNNLILKQINLEKIDEISKFDLIYSCDVLEHIKDDIVTLKNFHRALKPNGILLLHLPLRYNRQKRIFPWFKNYKTPSHVRDEYTEKEIIRKLNRTGFQVNCQGYGYGLFMGELAFELNNFINSNKYFLILSQLISWPFSHVLGYMDITRPPNPGNSLLITAKKRI